MVKERFSGNAKHKGELMDLPIGPYSVEQELTTPKDKVSCTTQGTVRIWPAHYWSITYGPDFIN
jgi:hypothetical protein